VCDLDGPGEFTEDLLGVDIPPSRAMLAIVLGSVHVEVEAVIPEKPDQIISFGEGVVGAVETLDNAAQRERRLTHRSSRSMDS
jgi:hypothetical protein